MSFSYTWENTDNRLIVWSWLDVRKVVVIKVFLLSVVTL